MNTFTPRPRSDHHPPLPNFTQPSVGKSLMELLLSTTSAADIRNQEVTLLFQNIACILDDATNGDCLQQHLLKPFCEFIADLNTVARRYFECHVRDTPRPPAHYSASQTQPQTRKEDHAVKLRRLGKWLSVGNLDLVYMKV
ncbi:Bgt-20260 [Blumeria graminis f. sp. tritici]|uniref:Bgt-20260 n=2 Tax=Blumeria graminis f. sp. tritici TaxID=62690 RepID=A0A9X9MEZ8_BLUGR|nr:Bgt-20260 [Blumeria graminis f. sp. tritici]